MSNDFHNVPDFKMPPRPNARVSAMIRDLLGHYKALVKQIGQSKSLKLIVCINGSRFISPISLGAYSDECIAIESRGQDGASLDIVPVELVSFTIHIADKKPEQPSVEIREIGFKAMMGK